MHGDHTLGHLTWMAICGDDPLNHPTARRPRTFQMTQKYIRTAEAVGEVIRATFPPLPESLAAGRHRQEYRPSAVQLVELIVEAQGIERCAETRT